MYNIYKSNERKKVILISNKTRVDEHGLKSELMDDIRSVCSRYPVDKAFLFGSRARDRYEKNSDIDIAVSLKEILNSSTINMIKNELEKLNTPLCFDLVNIDNIKKKALKENILKEGVLIYDRNQ